MAESISRASASSGDTDSSSDELSTSRISSNDESDEDDDRNESSPRPSGRPSITAANKKKLNYVRDYLERLQSTNGKEYKKKSSIYR